MVNRCPLLLNPVAESSSDQPVVNFQSAPHLIHKTTDGNLYLPLVGSTCWTFGRDDGNNFVLPDQWISRNHAMLQCMETGEFYLIDLGSRNGTFVNGRRVSIPITIQSGDRITFGQTELEFYCPHSTILNNLADQEPNSEAREVTATAILHVRKLISVLVIDIRNFTGLTRQMDEKVLSAMIGSWFRGAGDIIRNHGSWVDKYIGDAIMAVWIHESETVSHEEMVQIFHALSALRAMTSSLAENYPLPFPLRIGAGINTGYAMVGNTGSGDRPDYTALGDTVNITFRLESATKQIGCDVALGEQTYAHLAPLVTNNLVTNKSLFKQFAVDLKGYEVPMTTFACTFHELEEFLAQHGRQRVSGSN